MLFEEVQNHVTSLTDVRGIHGHLAEEILDVGAYDGERSEAVPQVVEGEKALCAHLGALVCRGDERASKLYRPRKILAHELLREVEHVARGEHGLAVGVDVGVTSQEITVAADDFLLFRIPHDKLLVAVVARVELVQIHALSAAASGLAECDFAQPAYFLEHVWRVVRRNYVYFIVALVCHAQLAVRRKLAFKQLFVYRTDNLLFHFLCRLMLVVDMGYAFVLRVVTVCRRCPARTAPTVPEFSTCRMSAMEWAFLLPRGTSCHGSCTSRRPDTAWQC